MSGAQTSTFPTMNELLAPMAAYDVHANALLQQQKDQQDISGHQIEMGARLASTLLDPAAYPTTEARAAAYPGLVARARAQFPGYFTNAPDTYPGDAATQALARMGTPSADLIKLQGTAGAVDAYGNSIGVSGGGGGGAPGSRTATGGTGGGGGSTGTIGGADTAPINAAGDSRTRKAGEGGPPAAGTPGAQVAQQVHDFWIGKGFSEAQVAGIMAGGPGSESDFTPTVFGDKGSSYGLYQHHGPRLAAMQQFFGLSGSQMPSADQQNQYAAWEISPQGPLANVGAQLKQAKSPAEAAAIWTAGFGVPADKTEIGRRARGADRYLNRYAGQPGAPGASTAPAVITGDVARPGDVPPPPGGAPGAYGGGGMGAVIGRPAAVSGTPIPAGRPTGPPVVTDQPAGGGVVAGPPGTAVVGAPQPPSPEVPGNVDAISRGIVARGGQPVTDPNLTPTPARYAGTAPAPSVEAAPQPGWGTGIGSGYGPQNTLAPPPPPAQPAAPAAQQPPASAQQPPAATASGLPPELQTDNSYLTPRDKQQLAPLFDQARRGLIPLTTLQNEVQQRQTFNVQRQKDFLAAQQQTFENQRQAEADRRAAETQRLAQEAAKLAQEKATREAAVAARPFQGTGMDPQWQNILDKGDDGSAQYARAYTAAATPKYNPADGSWVKPNMAAYDKPTYIPKGMTEPPDYTKQETPVPTQMSAPQTLAAGYADRMRNSLPVISDTSEAAMNRWQVLLGKAPILGNSLVSPEYQQHQQAERDFINAVLRRESGAAISEPEFVNARQQYIPQPGDSKEVRAQKQQNRETVMANLVRDAGPAYKPPAVAPPATTKPLSNTKIKVDADGNIIQ